MCFSRRKEISLFFFFFRYRWFIMLCCFKHKEKRFNYTYICMCADTQSCQMLCDPMDYSPPGSSLHGISQPRIWSRLPFPPPADLPIPGIEPVFYISCIGRQIIYHQCHLGRPIYLFIHTHIHTHICIYIFSNSLTLQVITRY